MLEKEIQDILIKILYYTVNETSGDTSFHEKFTSNVVTKVYRLAKKHSLEHLVSRYLFENEIPLEATLKEAFKSASIITAYKYERMKYAYNEICTAFDEVGIPYIPLKGSVLRSYYPEEDMRTSCDIDVLVHEDHIESAIRLLEEINYRKGEPNYHDVPLYAPNGTPLELHFNILENMDCLDVVLKDAWKYAELIDGSKYAFRKEFFVFHMYAHMAYHFFSGGCGIRSLMDIWIMEHNMGVDYKCAETLLKKAGIFNFAKEMSFIANRCLSDFDFSDQVLTYIWRGGVYGSKRNQIAVQMGMNGGTLAYVLKRIFLPYRTMIISYPILKTIPLLLPICWMHRGIKAIINRKKTRLVTEFACVNQISKNELDEITEICMRLGF